MDLFVRILTNTSVDRELAQWLIWFARESEWDIDIHYTFSHGVAEHRNVVLHEFLKTECSHLWFIDADTIPPKNLRWLDFLSDDVQILGCPYPGYFRGKLFWHVYDKGHPIRRSNWSYPLMSVDVMGTGCLVIDRRVFEKIGRPDPFCLVRNKDGSIGTEDVFFCETAKHLGVNVYAATKYTCGHIKDINLKNVI